MVQQLKHNLLRLPVIITLGLLSQANEVMVECFSQDLVRTFEGDFEIHLRPDAQPFALHTHRNVPLPLRKHVKDKLKRMESLGVIFKVDVATPLCAGMAMVPKQDCNVRICVDLKPLNAHALHETHPLPKVDDVLAQLAATKIFSKLDANSGPWKISLADHLHYSLCFNKMPFGISSAQEHFQ